MELHARPHERDGETSDGCPNSPAAIRVLARRCSGCGRHVAINPDHIAGGDGNVDWNKRVGGLIQAQRQLRERVSSGGKNRRWNIAVKMNDRKILERRSAAGLRI